LLHKEVDGPVTTSPTEIDDDTPTVQFPVITESLLQQYSPAMVTIASALVTMSEIRPIQPRPQTRAAANHQWLTAANAR
jgi:hypothetical protein